MGSVRSLTNILSGLTSRVRFYRAVIRQMIMDDNFAPLVKSGAVFLSLKHFLLCVLV